MKVLTINCTLHHKTGQIYIFTVCISIFYRYKITFLQNFLFTDVQTFYMEWDEGKNANISQHVACSLYK